MAGSFYPADPGTLARTVDALLGDADARGSHELVPTAPPLAIIAPHAGYVYSGAVAASVYAELRGRAARIRRVVLLGPSHFVRIRGAALPEVRAFATPLGNVGVDRAALARIEELRGALYDERTLASIRSRFSFPSCRDFSAVSRSCRSSSVPFRHPTSPT